MTNLFLKVNKDLFGLGLNPTEILLLAQIMEFNTNTGDCFISNKTLAENFGVSESTIKRELERLEKLGYITRETRNIKGGKERHMVVNMDKLTSSKLSLVDTNKVQNEPCTRLKMSFDKVQNEPIKDNIKDKELKDNNCVLLPSGNKTAAAQSATASISQQPQVMSSQEAMKRYGIGACANRVAAGISGCYWIDGELVKLC